MESVARFRVVSSVSAGTSWLLRKSQTSKKWSRAGSCPAAHRRLLVVTPNSSIKKIKIKK